MTFTQSTVLPLAIDEAFALVTEPERLRRWQTVTARVDLRAGGEYRWTIVPGHAASGTFREVEPGRRVVFGFGWEGEGDPSPDSSTVTITLEPEGAHTRVTLQHTGLTDVQAERHAEGWAHFMGRLEKAAAEGDAGVDAWAWVPDPLDELSAAEAALGVLLRVLRQAGPEHADRPTGCADFSCAELVDHLDGSMRTFTAMAGGEVTRGPEAEDTWEQRIAVLADQAVEAWRARGLEGSVGEGERQMPAAFAAGIMPVEFLLHAWDLARGVEAEVEVSDEVVGYVHELAEKLVPGGRGSAFADEVAVDSGVDPMSRLAAYSGRDPLPA